MQDTVYGYVERFVDYLEAEKHASRYTVRNYRGDLIGNLQHGTQKGFFQFLDRHRLTGSGGQARHARLPGLSGGPARR
jgi:site-specific recombinase XerC